MTSESPGGTAGTPPDGDGAAVHGTAVHDAVVLAGGGARRLAGEDKPSLTVGARTLLDRVLGACAGAATTVVVGPRRPTYRPVTWVREDPPGGGPLAALHAGLREVTAETVLVLSADLPFLRAATVRALVDGAASGDEDGALLHDGRDQPLLAAYRTESLRRELALLHTEYGAFGGLPLRLLLPELRLRRIPAAGPAAADGAVGVDGADAVDAVDALDCDTWDDVAAARARIRERDTVLDEWLAAVKAELGVELDVDTTTLLDLARDAAHNVTRPAAPLTTFLVGYAAARHGGTPEQVAEAAQRAARLAARWAEETAENEETAETEKARETSGRTDGEQGDGR